MFSIDSFQSRAQDAREMIRNHSSLPQDGEGNNLGSSQPINESVFHSNTLVIPIHCLGTSIRSAENVLQEKFRGSIVELSALYHFDLKLFQLDLIPEELSQIKYISSEVFCKDSVNLMAFERNGDSFTVNLARRHPFDKQFVILFKYAFIEQSEVLTAESKYRFEVRFKLDFPDDRS